LLSVRRRGLPAERPTEAAPRVPGRAQGDLQAHDRAALVGKARPHGRRVRVAAACEMRRLVPGEGPGEHATVPQRAAANHDVCHATRQGRHSEAGRPKPRVLRRCGVTQQKWLTTQDLADRFNCSPDTVLKRAKEENWPHQKIGGRMYRFTPEQVEAIEAMTEVKPSTE